MAERPLDHPASEGSSAPRPDTGSSGSAPARPSGSPASAEAAAWLDAIPDAIFRIDLDGTCRGARLGALFRLFPPPAACSGAPLEEIFEQALADQCRAAITKCAEGEPIHFEHAFKGPRGDAYLDVCVARADGGAVVLVRDSTVTRRFRDWMVRSERLASIGGLATSAAHEINNPLTAVVANSDFARDLVAASRAEAEVLLSADDPTMSSLGRRLHQRLGEAEHALEEAIKGASRIADAVRALKAIAGPTDDVPASVVLEATLETALRVVKNHIRHRAELVQSFARLPPVWGNASRLEDVFVSLLVNAAEAIEPGRADQNQIHVRVEESSDGRVTVEISDTGAGIAPEDVAHVFDPFYTTKPPGTGTGLGLSVCRAIVSSYGGEVDVSSELGVGTTFRVTLLSAKSAPSPRPTVPVARPSRLRGRVAVIDDEALVGSAIERMLADDHELFVTQSGQAVLDALARGERFDVILCDVMMPVMTGVDFHRQLLAEHRDYAPRVVFISGGVFTDEMSAALASLPNVTLDKPVSREKLERVVAAHVSRARATSPPEPRD